jgi:hypothetical protein
MQWTRVSGQILRTRASKAASNLEAKLDLEERPADAAK